MSDRWMPRRLLLVFGTLVALGNLVGWTVADYHRLGTFTLRGVERAVFVLTAVLALYLVLRLALLVTHRDAA